jgi:alpha-tubulin suppressor-like RCC1 family protein
MMIYTVLYAAWLFAGSVGAWTLQTPLKHMSAAVALKANGALVAWGSGANGGDTTVVSGHLTSGVDKVYATISAFAALKDDGSVVVWGDPHRGGTIIGAGSDGHFSHMFTVVDIIPNDEAFAAVADDGTIYVWGSTDYGGLVGNSNVFTPTSPVTKIIPSSGAFTALFQDGTVFTWGESSMTTAFTAVATQLVNVKKVFSTAFCVCSNPSRWQRRDVGPSRPWWRCRFRR